MPCNIRSPLRMRLPGLCAVLAFAVLACTRDAGAPLMEGTEAAASDDAGSTARATPEHRGASPTAGSNRAALAERRGTEMRASVSVVHQYLQRVSQREFDQADALWAYRRSPAPGEESGLRALGDVRVMRIDNDPPVPLDEEPIPAAVEVPVRLLATFPDNRQARFSGYYRLRRNPVEGRWELIGASLHPVLR